ncbi:MAG: AraC family transcriptional regulator [Alphaproteobacteria bacterium]
MGTIEKAVWYLETHLENSVTLDDVATIADVSRFHLTRAFGYAVGCTPITYLRRRRLSEAAKALATGSDTILNVALQFDYNSHEAFTRAFRDQFGITPTDIRRNGSVQSLALTAPYYRSSQTMKHMAPARIATMPDLHFAGLPHQYAETGSPEIPGQWLKFAPHIGTIPNQKGHTTFGLCFEGDGTNFLNYVAAVETDGAATDLPPELKAFHIEAQTYAVFWHGEHVSAAAESWGAIFSNWLPAATYTPQDAPSFERYDDRFNPMTGHGGFELWLPVQAKSG